MRPLSDSASRLSGQAAYKVLARAKEMERQGRKILHFEIGEPDFRSPGHVVESAKRALDAGKTQYSPSQGIIELRQAICDEMERTRGFRPDPDQVLVMPGANPALFYAVSLCVGKGENVVVQDPGFMTYYAVLNYLAPETRRVRVREENEFRMAPQEVRDASDKNTALIIMNSPQNPTGSVMTPAEIDEMAQIAEERNCFLLSDEIYSRLIYEGKHHTPALRDECRERTIILDGFSKSYAMTGWRLGYMVGPRDFIAKASLLLQTIDSTTNTFIQHAGIDALNGPQEQVDRMRGEYRKRRDAIVSGLNRVPGVSCVKPQGAFYAFPNITKSGKTSQEYAEWALDKLGIAILPGTGFGPAGEGYVRFSYATAMDKIEEAMKLMREGSQ